MAWLAAAKLAAAKAAKWGAKQVGPIIAEEVGRRVVSGLRKKEDTHVRPREGNRKAGRERGTVKWFDDAKGFGFIESESGEDVFVHHSDIRGEGFRSLADGQQVEFEVVQGEKGPEAESVVAL